jgi:hypothetical protein
MSLAVHRIETKALAPAGDSRAMSRMAASALALIACAATAGAQMPGSPVLQNAWAAPGIVLALDISGGSGSTYAGALGWAPSSGRFQLSGGAGIQSDNGSRGVYGARLALPLAQLMGGNLGIAAFAGIGGGSGSSTDTTQSATVVPAGLAAGYRRAIGTSGRGFSIFVDPNYQYHSGDAGSDGYFRVGFGVDAGLSSRFGITLGGEAGSSAPAGSVGPDGTLYGIAVSMKIGG